MAVTTNQGFILPDGTDNANVPLTFTDFVLGATGMENHVVERYLSAADRLARNATPTKGELSYLSDTDSYESYNGSAWVPIIKGFVNDATRSSNSAAFTTSEIITDSLTFVSAGPTTRYKLSYTGNCLSTISNDIVAVRLRYQAGGSLTTAGTLFDASEQTMTLTVRAFPVNRFKTITGIAAGTTSIGVGMVRALGTGSLTSTGAAQQQNYLLLETV